MGYDQHHKFCVASEEEKLMAKHEVSEGLSSFGKVSKGRNLG
jgi:hypothetical protein